MSTPAPPLSATVLLVVALGGAIGSVARYGAGVVMAPHTTTFPWATLLVNVLGAFLIGWFARLFAAPDADHVMRLALTTGFCGGFTTFSTFTAEFMHQVQAGDWRSAVLYAGISFFGGLGVFVAGLRLGKLI